MLKAFSLVSLLCLPVFAQQSSAPGPDCKSKFAVIYHDERLPQPYSIQVTKQQSQWWSKSGQKKYKTFCLDSNDADYLVVWAAPVQGVEERGDRTLKPVSRSFVYITHLSKRTPVEDALIYGKPEGSVIYEKEILPGTPWWSIGEPYSKDLSQTVLEEALKNMAKLNP